MAVHTKLFRLLPIPVSEMVVESVTTRARAHLLGTGRNGIDE